MFFNKELKAKRAERDAMREQLVKEANEAQRLFEETGDQRFRDEAMQKAAEAQEYRNLNKDGGPVKDKAAGKYARGGAVKKMAKGGSCGSKGYAKGGGVCRGGGAATRGIKFRGVK